MDFDIFIKRDVKRARDIVYCKILCSIFVRVGKILYLPCLFSHDSNTVKQILEGGIWFLSAQEKREGKRDAMRVGWLGF
ncbi:hypothetical protein L2E82_02704 [Cichorium intybus]|uniref:Uncharacterized protein n=1 Tax=Cichorium intybus TaxID=13427 RepID=A0ACB9H383_CICIN|nr:hypothetical protein L2E82_02704 [Cichorium intybus]